MSRANRLVVPGEPHHLTHRGNNRKEIFFDKSCYYVYLGLVKKGSLKHDVSIIGYCLMPNHIHLIVIPPNKVSLARFVCETARGYTGYINDRKQRSGHLWERRYYSCPLEPDHLWRGLRYVELNPVRAGLVDSAADYPWSSALPHTQDSAWHQCQALLPLRPVVEPWDSHQWQEFLGEGDQHEDKCQIHRCTFQGRPWGSEPYVNRLQANSRRMVRPWSAEK